jgi:hypothetical protein
MNNLSLKQKIIGAIAIVGAILIFIFQRGLSSGQTVEKVPLENTQTQVQTDKPELIQTNPSPLNEATFWALQPIELAFNLPLENIPEFKHTISPKYDYKIELSGDKKTITITPTKPLPLGTTFTLSISGETKFEGKKTLEKDYIFHYRTIEYKGV